MRNDWIPSQHLAGLSDQFTYTMEPHSPHRIKSISFALVCKYCGLIYLKNDLTRWAIKMGCNNRYHPDIKKLKQK